jgi:hypothetical protein
VNDALLAYDGKCRCTERHRNAIAASDAALRSLSIITHFCFVVSVITTLTFSIVTHCFFSAGRVSRTSKRWQQQHNERY